MQKVQKIGRNDPCWCGSGHKYKDCHLDFDVKLSEYRRKGSKVPNHAMIKNPEQIAGIRESAKINVAVLDYVAEHIHDAACRLEPRKGICQLRVHDREARTQVHGVSHRNLVTSCLIALGDDRVAASLAARSRDGKHHA